MSKQKAQNVYTRKQKNEEIRFVMKFVYWTLILCGIGVVGWIGWEAFLLFYAGMR